ncbi:type I-E CRISPR-associated endonuclease Cas1e [Allokutzneria sp. NRRL B-24872]|uniref:type I-E CRISPR-associated endonuclease Cas1e n=1 Tax=Allokutzneria sp. NRRL B-24872 TaxID=1137961 RepID=UPI000A366F1C|nr:type I-E CRISPR-associated endonuclease Cas1e [Allokutzneria sp. NRRL B-24872]
MGQRLPATLGAPTAIAVPRVSDRLSFLYLDTVRITADRNGVCASADAPSGPTRVHLPTAGIASVLLGPGTSITHAAITTLTRDGATVAFTGDGGVRCYSAFLHDSTSTTVLDRQVAVVSNDQQRLAAAQRLYQLRFHDPLPDELTLARLRGLEGQRVKAHYRVMAQQHGLPRFRRSYDPHDWPSQDPVNMALTAGNTALYGIVTAVILSLGASPALGILHHGQQRAFTYDIADLYKADVVIPLAFSLHAHPTPDREVRRRLRDKLRLLRLIPRIVDDIHHVLGLSTPDTPPRGDLIDLWDPEGNVASGRNYSDTVDW